MGIGNRRTYRINDADYLSLPLMGIGNAAANALVTADIDPSLPLMGIGNAAWRIAAWGVTSSLPLMGIGNSSRSSTRAGRPGTHYPSWGSGTARGHGRRRRVALITPHGDREPTCCRRGSPAVRLITPHGDRERPARQRRGAAVLLITPHGDREHGRPGAAGGPVRLITPHGDREPERRPDRLDR